MSVAILFPDTFIVNSLCENCKKVYQNYTKEISSYSKSLNESCEYSHEFKKIFLSGENYVDQILLNGFFVNKSLCVANTFYDPLNYAEDGILGLGNDSSSFVYSMYLDGLIDKPLYSIYSVSLNTSELVFGSVDFGELNLNLHSQTKVIYKNGLFAKFQYKDVVYEKRPAEIDSLYSYVAGPYSQMRYFYDSLIEDYKCYNFIEFIICDCKGTYPDLQFIIQSTTLKIPSANYLKKVSHN